MQKEYYEINLKPYAIKSSNSKGRIYQEKENSIRFHVSKESQFGITKAEIVY